MRKSWIPKISHLSVFILVTIFLCEYLMYYIVIVQCSWPTLDDKFAEKNISKNSESELRAMFLADTHLLGPYKGHWLDKLRREWQMYRAFQTAVNFYNPEVVFILGDLFDEGQYCNEEQFEIYLKRFQSLFYVPDGVRLYVVPGNHDLGFHYRLRYDLYTKFNTVFNTSAVKFKNLKGNYFIFINSMAMHGDECYFCNEAETKIMKLSKKLNCLKTGEICQDQTKLKTYTRPIILQHFPMYRESEAVCNEIDMAPENIKNDRFKEKWDCLSKDSSEMIYNLLNPRLIFSGHTHHGCSVKHRQDIMEYTLSSFNWRNKNNPTIMLGVFISNNYAIKKCKIPEESTTIYLYILSVFGSISFSFISSKY